MIKRHPTGFTIIELLTVVSILTVLTAVMVPVLRQTRYYGRRVLSIHRQRQIVHAVTLYAFDNRSEFPPSVALCRISGRRYRWQDPRKVKTTRPLVNMEHNSVAGYLESYLVRSESLYCPSSPGHWPYWQEACRPRMIGITPRPLPWAIRFSAPTASSGTTPASRPTASSLPWSCPLRRGPRPKHLAGQ